MAIVKTLRGYQADLYRRLNRARNNGKDAVMLLPTGAGKTAIARNVLRQADRWFVSFILRETNEVPELANINEIEERDVLGVDLGVKELAITSTGERFENPKAYNSHLKKLQRYQRMASRRVKGSNNRKKAITKLAKVHKRVADIRNDEHLW